MIGFVARRPEYLAFKGVFESLRVLLLKGTANCGTGEGIISPKPDSDELDGPFSSGFLKAPAAVNNSVQFVRFKPQNRNTRIRRYLPLSFILGR